MRSLFRIALAMLALSVTGCAAAPPRLSLSPAWPERVDDYQSVTAAWTRRAVLRGQYQQVLELHGTFRSPAWRAARAAREADIRNLRGAAREAVLADARTAADGDYEVALVMITYDRTENDLHHGARSVWRMRLVNDRGQEFEPIAITRDRRPLEILKAEFPAANEFAEVYIATFPRSADVLRDDARQVGLKLWSPRGGVELTWLAP